VNHFEEPGQVTRANPGGGRTDALTIGRPMPTQLTGHVSTPVQYRSLANCSSPIVRASMTPKRRMDKPKENAADILAAYKAQQRAPTAQKRGNPILHSLSGSGSIVLPETAFLSKAQDAIELHEEVTDFVRSQQAEQRAKSAAQPVRHLRPYRDISHDVNHEASRDMVAGLPYGLQYREVCTALRKAMSTGSTPQAAVHDLQTQNSVQLARMTLKTASQRQHQLTQLDPHSIGGLEGNALIPSELSSPLPGMHSASRHGPVTSKGQLFSKTARFLPPPGEKFQRVDAPVGEATVEMYGATWLHKSPAVHNPVDAFPTASRAAINGAGIRTKLNSTRHRALKAGVGISSPAASFREGSISPVRSTLSVKKSFRVGVKQAQHVLKQHHLSAIDRAAFHEEVEAETRIIAAGGGFRVKVPRKLSNPGYSPSARELLAAKQQHLDACSSGSTMSVLTSSGTGGAHRRRRRPKTPLHSLSHIPNKEIVYHGSAGFADRIVNSPAASGLLADFQRREAGNISPLFVSPENSLKTGSAFSL